MKRFFPRLPFLLASIGTALSPLEVSGQVMLSPVAVVGTDLGTFSPEAPLVNMINQSGLDNPFVSGVTSFNTYFAVPSQTFATNGAVYNWQSDTVFTLPVTGFVDFDLGASHQVTKLAVWNVTAKNVTVSFADEPAELATAPGAGDFLLTNHASFTFSYPVDILVFASPQRGRHMRIAIRSDYPLFPGFTFGYAILGEVVASVAGGSSEPEIALAQATNGDVVITFTGRLQSTTTLVESFADVPENPRGSYTIPMAALPPQQFFRARPE